MVALEGGLVSLGWVFAGLVLAAFRRRREGPQRPSWQDRGRVDRYRLEHLARTFEGYGDPVMAGQFRSWADERWRMDRAMDEIEANDRRIRWLLVGAAALFLVGAGVCLTLMG